MGASDPSALLSIVIPTRNRISYATHAIQTILSMPDTDLELVVQDNGDSRDLESFVQTRVSDQRLRYHYTPPPFSPIDNFNAGVGLATGRYVCVLGDDDGVNPEVMEAARWAEAQGIDALTPVFRADYLWPGVSYSAHDIRSGEGTLSIARFSGQVTFPEPETELRKLLRTGGVPFVRQHLPKLYQGVIRRDCLERVRGKTGRCFGGLTPDLYANVTLSRVTRRFAVVDYPLMIAGACPASTTAACYTGKHTGSLADAPHLRNYPNYPWSNLVPKFYSLETFCAETVARALMDMECVELLRRFNVPFLAAICLLRHPSFAKTSWEGFSQALRLRHESRLMGCVRLGIEAWRGSTARFLRGVNNRVRVMLTGPDVHRIRDLPDIPTAQQALNSYLSERGLRFSQCVRGEGVELGISS